MNKLIKLFLAILMLNLYGCSITPTDSTAAKNIYVSSKKPSECEYIGQIFSSDGNWFTGIFTPSINIIISSRNKFKNQAAYNGANYIQLQATHADDTAFIVGGNQNIVFIGQAYYCEKLIEAIKANNRQL